MAVVVVFSSRRTAHGDAEYAELAERMEGLVREQPGFLDIVSVRDPGTRHGITVARFVDAAAVAAWREHVEHLAAQDLGRRELYEEYRVIVADIDREYSWP